jgi:hypothetical protein
MTFLTVISKSQTFYNRAIESLVCWQEAVSVDALYSSSLLSSPGIIGSDEKFRRHWCEQFHKSNQTAGNRVENKMANYGSSMKPTSSDPLIALTLSPSSRKEGLCSCSPQAFSHPGLMATTRFLKTLFLRGQHRCFTASTNVPATRLE